MLDLIDAHPWLVVVVMFGIFVVAERVDRHV